MQIGVNSQVKLSRERLLGFFISLLAECQVIVYRFFKGSYCALNAIGLEGYNVSYSQDPAVKSLSRLCDMAVTSQFRWGKHVQ